MNLLLYTQSRISLSRLRDVPTSGDSPIWGNIDAMTLPDSVFEELGYFGALDETDEIEASGPDADDPYEELFRSWKEPLLIG